MQLCQCCLDLPGKRQLHGTLANVHMFWPSTPVAETAAQSAGLGVTGVQIMDMSVPTPQRANSLPVSHPTAAPAPQPPALGPQSRHPVSRPQAPAPELLGAVSSSRAQPANPSHQKTLSDGQGPTPQGHVPEPEAPGLQPFGPAAPALGSQTAPGRILVSGNQQHSAAGNNTPPPAPAKALRELASSKLPDYHIAIPGVSI